MTDSEFCAECEKRAEKIGRPEWDDDTEIRWHLVGGCQCAEMIDGDENHMLTDHEAACLWERHVREWLISRGCIIALSPTGHTITLLDPDAVRSGAPTMDDLKFHIESDDYYSALLAAVDAVEEKT